MRRQIGARFYPRFRAIILAAGPAEIHRRAPAAPSPPRLRPRWCWCSSAALLFPGVEQRHHVRLALFEGTRHVLVRCERVRERWQVPL